MEDVPPSDNEYVPMNFSARFDFKGDLLPYDNQNIQTTTGLHHHGEEPHRPGYTLEELMRLARSTNAQQASIAIQACGSCPANTNCKKQFSFFFFKANVNINKHLQLWFFSQRQTSIFFWKCIYFIFVNK